LDQSRNGTTLVRSAAYTYDRMNRLVSAAFDRDGSGAANGISTTLTHDAAGRLVGMMHHAPTSGVTLTEFGYTVNGRGDRTQAYEKLARSGGGQDEHTLVYAYDGRRRLKSATRYAGTPTTTNSTYDAANRLSSAGFAYDNAGRLTSDGTNSYTWDRANRLLSMGGAI
jgi:hypothetical protein